MPHLAALSLTTPLMLWGAALVAFPLLAHLLNRKARRRVIFPTIRLLQQSSAAQSRPFKLRRWMILALRCLFVVLIAAAFARPLVFADRRSEASAGRGTAVVVVLDVSVSATQETGGSSQFDAMRASAARLLEGLRSGTDVADVVLAGDRSTLLFPRLTPNVTALQEQLRSLKPGFARADLPRALAAAGELLSNFGGQKRIVILSDMQRTNWQDGDQNRLSELFPPGAQITVIEPEGTPPDNIALSNPRTAPPQPLVGRSAQCIVRVSNFSKGTREIPLTLERGREAPESQTVRLEAGEEREVGFATEWTEAEEQTVTFSIPTDALAADDRVSLVARPVHRLPVLIVGDDDPREPGTGLYFLQRSLAPLGTAEDRFEPRVVDSSLVTAKDLATAGVVFLESISPSSPHIGAFAAHLKSGGSLVVFAGDPGMLRTLQILNGAFGGGGALPWTPGPVRELTSARELLTISGGQWRSRLLRDFDEQSQLALSQIHFHRVLSSSDVNPEADVLLTFSDGTPALASRQVGSGQLLVAAFSADLASSDFGKFGSFVALMQLLARELRPSVDLGATGLVGQPWSRRDPIPASSETLQLIDPSGSPVPVTTPGSADEPITPAIDFPEKPGVYRFQRGGRTVASAAFQIDPRESKLERLPKPDLERLLRSRGPANDVVRLDGAAANLTNHGRPLWHWLIVLALIAGALELACVACWPR